MTNERAIEILTYCVDVIHTGRVPNFDKPRPTNEELEEALRICTEAASKLDAVEKWLEEGFKDADELWQQSYDDTWREARRDTLEDVLNYFKEL